MLLLVVLRQRHVAVKAAPADAADERQSVFLYRYCCWLRLAAVRLRQGRRHSERHQVFGVRPLDVDGHVAVDALPLAVGAGLELGERDTRQLWELYRLAVHVVVVEVPTTFRPDRGGPALLDKLLDGQFLRAALAEEMVERLMDGHVAP